MDHSTKQAHEVYQGCKYFSFCPRRYTRLEVQRNRVQEVGEDTYIGYIHVVFAAG